MSRRFSPSAWHAALALLALSMMAAPARSEPGEGVQTFSCYSTWSWNSETCITSFRSGRFNPHVIYVPAPASADELAAAQARERRWTERCRPQISQDPYGMPRYTYNAAGCEFGRLE